MFGSKNNICIFIVYNEMFFTATEVSNIESAEIQDKTEVQLVARLLGVDANRLYNGLTSKTIYTREEAVTSSLSHDASLDVRDAFVKVIITYD